MGKQESLDFLQGCTEKVKNATDRDIQFYKEVYNREYVYARKEIRIMDKKLRVWWKPQIDAKKSILYSSTECRRRKESNGYSRCI